MKFKKTEIKKIQLRYRNINQKGGSFDSVVKTITNMIDGLINSNYKLKIKYNSI